MKVCSLILLTFAYFLSGAASGSGRPFLFVLGARERRVVRQNSGWRYLDKSGWIESDNHIVVVIQSHLSVVGQNDVSIDSRPEGRFCSVSNRRPPRCELCLSWSDLTTTGLLDNSGARVEVLHLKVCSLILLTFAYFLSGAASGSGRPFLFVLGARERRVVRQNSGWRYLDKSGWIESDNHILVS